MKRYGMTRALKPEALEEYKEHHRCVWPGVEAGLKKAGPVPEAKPGEWPLPRDSVASYTLLKVCVEDGKLEGAFGERGRCRGGLGSRGAVVRRQTPGWWRPGGGNQKMGFAKRNAA